MNKARLDKTLAKACITILLFLTGCSYNKPLPDKDSQESLADRTKTKEYHLIPDEEFGGAFFDIAIDDFESLYDIAYGDSVNVFFSNGTILKDIPFYNGYYTKTGEYILVAYPGYPHMKVCINNGDDIWKLFDLSKEQTLRVELNEKGKYLDIQEARNIAYFDERKRYESDEQFANFRAVSMPSIKENILYRGASPCDNQHNRASFADRLIKNAGVSYVLNLADNDEKINSYMQKTDFASPYYKTLFSEGRVAAIAVNSNYRSEQFKSKLGDGLKKLIESDGPYYVHCTEGKDRTGFVIALLEALCGATYQELVDDYMITYDNYYFIQSGEPKYEIIVRDVFNDLVAVFTNDEPVNYQTADLSLYANNYLLECGLSEGEIALLRSKQSK